jgi:hypothetical protein
MSVRFSIECLEARTLPSLVSAPVYPAGTFPVSVAVGDFDGDGHPDLAVANYAYAGTVSVLRNKGNGTFRTPVSYAAGHYPTSVAVGDFNGDGHPDLAVADGDYDGTVSILRNNGDGTFAAPLIYGVGCCYASSVAVGDFNGDGRPDLAVTNDTDDGRLRILLGNGDGTFRNAGGYLAGIGPTFVTAADFDGNGHLDLAIASAEEILVLRGNGSGAFGPPSDYYYKGGHGASTLAVADLDGDGHPDLAAAVTTFNPNRRGWVSVWRNKGDGTFQPNGGYGLLDRADAIVSGDLNADGRPDLAVSGGSTFSVLLGQGNGLLQADGRYALGPYPLSLAVGDFDGDHHADLAVADRSIDISSTDGAVTVALGNGDGTFQAAKVYVAGAETAGLVTVDLDGDAHADLAVAEHTPEGMVTVLRGDGQGGFGGPKSYPAGPYPNQMAVGDFDENGTPDLAVTNDTSVGTINVLMGNGDASFAGPVSYTSGGSYAFSVAVGDFDGDGHQDLAITNAGSDTVSILRGKGDGSFEAGVSYPAGKETGSVVVGDFDGDGRLDLVVVNGDVQYGAVSVLRGKGDGTFEAFQSYPAGHEPVAVTVGDFDGDGHPDLASANLDVYGTTVNVLRGKGDGTFAPPVGYAVGKNAWSIMAGDFNGDGRTDLAAGTETGVFVLLGKGDGTFLAGLSFAPLTSTYALAAGDLNGDGRSDLVAAATLGGFGQTSSLAMVLLNDGNWPPLPPAPPAVPTQVDMAFACEFHDPLHPPTPRPPHRETSAGVGSAQSTTGSRRRSIALASLSKRLALAGATPPVIVDVEGIFCLVTSDG